MVPKFRHPDEIQVELSEKEARHKKAHENLMRLSSLTTEEQEQTRIDLALSREIYDLRQDLREMTFLKDLLECFDIYGKVYLHKWERDCDCVEFTSAYEFDTSEEAYDFIQSAYEGAEGPISWDVISQEDYIEFSPEERDRVLEAFENGHSYRV